MKIAVISGSNRDSRGTPRVAEWVVKTARTTQPDTEFELVDLADYDLPFMTEPLPPMAGQRPELAESVKKWLEKLGEADGFVIVTPEYNHSVPAALKNAIDTLDYQLLKKPVAIVSHGAMGGARANEHLRLIINSNLGGVPIAPSVTLKGYLPGGEVIDESGVLSKNHANAQQPLEDLIENIVWYTDALKTKRES